MSYNNLELVSKETDKVKVRVNGEDHTLLNVLRENAWKNKADQATYTIEHPYLSEPEIIIKAKSPLKVLEDSAQELVQQTKELEKEFARTLKK